jgi:single-strand DNA-binding protein
MQMLGSRGDESGGGYNRDAQSTGSYQGNQNQGQNQNQSQSQSQGQQSQVEEPPFNPDDDIPF